MKRVVARLLLVAAFMLLVAAPTGISVSASAAPASVVAVQQPTPTPNPTAPTGPNLTPEQQSDKAKQKLFIGIMAAMLLAIVIVGRSTRRRIRRKKQGAVSS
ncbi:MAG TPA: hypothetical protein VFV67_34535 [Actinophytocola sp.]|uniref:hypothetical protein n=1 Tax=Actinophytocola sp. TaxID=1872138 RepID=UPI002DB88B33|nr:hypothetical protein [Actinophytocola sp.]HEU5475783.1 hypothetical protein [Actinophytocola sp.]